MTTHLRHSKNDLDEKRKIYKQKQKQNKQIKLDRMFSEKEIKNQIELSKKIYEEKEDLKILLDINSDYRNILLKKIYFTDILILIFSSIVLFLVFFILHFSPQYDVSRFVSWEFIMRYCKLSLFTLFASIIIKFIKYIYPHLAKKDISEIIDSKSKDDSIYEDNFSIYRILKDIVASSTIIFALLKVFDFIISL